ncbi:MAG: hypothetical protein FJW56_03255 [Actinobacteria bacterium]|nr:hypothetical protein [Actinomycetota bacterium]
MSEENIKRENLKIAKRLLEYHKFPYLNRGTAEDLKNFETAKLYPNNFIIDGDYLYTYKDLRNFWIDEIKYYFEFEGKNEIDLYSLTKNGLESFYNKYKSDHPRIDEIYLNVSDENNMLLHLFPRYPGVGIGEFDSIRYFILFRILPTCDFCEVDHKKNEYPIRKKIRKIDSIENAAKLILLQTKEKKLSINQLIHLLDRSILEFKLKKPINKRELIELLEKHPNRFRVKKPSEVDYLLDPSLGDFPVELIEDLNSTIEQIRLNSRNYNEINFEELENKSGLLTIEYIGTQFPFEDAREYVKIRPIIFCNDSDNLKYDISEIFNFSTFNQSLIVLRLSSILKDALKLIPEDTNSLNSIKNWLNENLKIGYYLCDKEEAESIAMEIIAKFSPMLNIENNPGNLFSITISQKVEEFKKMLEKKNE